MKKLLLLLFIFLLPATGFCQAYIPMPADSAVWRYRIYNVDFITQVLDNILFLNGTDTIANGNAYHKIISRSFNYTVPNGTIPPIINAFANLSDQYYGAIRESSKQVFLLDGTGEDLLFDFNAGVGDSIPAYGGKDKVTGIDSIVLNGVYHKMYLTNDSTYFVIEGVGSNRGLIPQINDGENDVQFFCFTYGAVTYSPDTTIPCTTIYQIGHESVPGINSRSSEPEVFPNPANNILHVKLPAGYDNAQLSLYDLLGRTITLPPSSGTDRSLSTKDISPGLYLLRAVNGNSASVLSVEIK